MTTLLCYTEPQVRELLGIPDGLLTAAHIAVGYPANGFPRRLTRSPVAETVFAETYGRAYFTDGAL